MRQNRLFLYLLSSTTAQTVSEGLRWPARGPIQLLTADHHPDVQAVAWTARGRRPRCRAAGARAEGGALSVSEKLLICGALRQAPADESALMYRFSGGTARSRWAALETRPAWTTRSCGRGGAEELWGLAVSPLTPCWRKHCGVRPPPEGPGGEVWAGARPGGAAAPGRCPHRRWWSRAQGWWRGGIGRHGGRSLPASAPEGARARRARRRGAAGGSELGKEALQRFLAVEVPRLRTAPGHASGTWRWTAARTRVPSLLPRHFHVPLSDGRQRYSPPDGDSPAAAPTARASVVAPAHPSPRRRVSRGAPGATPRPRVAGGESNGCCAPPRHGNRVGHFSGSSYAPSPIPFPTLATASLRGSG